MIIQKVFFISVNQLLDFFLRHLQLLIFLLFLLSHDLLMQIAHFVPNFLDVLNRYVFFGLGNPWMIFQFEHADSLPRYWTGERRKNAFEFLTDNYILVLGPLTIPQFPKLRIFKFA